MTEQQLAFWDTISIFRNEGLLPYVMLIGSWAEYIFQHHLATGYQANLKTRDVDFLYPNLNRPQNQKIRIVERMEERGFIYTVDRLSGVGKFIKEDFLELEFVTRVLGEGQPVNKIPSLNIKAEGLREVNILANYPLMVECNGFSITVPEPEAYILQKLFAYPTRKPEYKIEKDIQSVKELLHHINVDRLKQIYSDMPKKSQKTISETKAEHFIEF